MRSAFFVFFIFLSTLVFSQEKPAESPKIAIKIPLGETISIENHFLKFVKVLEDSRCPKNTTCIWEGRAKVQLEIWQEGEDSIYKEIIFGKVTQGESKDKVLVSNENFKVMAMMLNPYPNSVEAIDGATYVLLVYKAKNN